MVRASISYEPTSRSVSEWVWPDPIKPGKARFVLHDQWEEELWDLLELSWRSACGKLATAESGLVEALKKVRVAWQTTSDELLSFSLVSLDNPSFTFVSSMAGRLFWHF
jgi:hypothetical protein